MPRVLVHASVQLDEAATTALLTNLSKAVALALDKPEEWVMVVFSPGAVSFGGQSPAASVDIDSIGKINKATNTAVTAAVCSQLEAIGIPGSRVYVFFRGANFSPCALRCCSFYRIAQ